MNPRHPTFEAQNEIADKMYSQNQLGYILVEGVLRSHNARPNDSNKSSPYGTDLLELPLRTKNLPLF